MQKYLHSLAFCAGLFCFTPSTLAVEGELVNSHCKGFFEFLRNNDAAGARALFIDKQFTEEGFAQAFTASRERWIVQYGGVNGVSSGASSSRKPNRGERSQYNATEMASVELKVQTKTGGEVPIQCELMFAAYQWFLFAVP